MKSISTFGMTHVFFLSLFFLLVFTIRCSICFWCLWKAQSLFLLQISLSDYHIKKWNEIPKTLEFWSSFEMLASCVGLPKNILQETEHHIIRHSDFPQVCLLWQQNLFIITLTLMAFLIVVQVNNFRIKNVNKIVLLYCCFLFSPHCPLKLIRFLRISIK